MSGNNLYLKFSISHIFFELDCAALFTLFIMYVLQTSAWDSEFILDLVPAFCLLVELLLLLLLMLLLLSWEWWFEGLSVLLEISRIADVVVWLTMDHHSLLQAILQILSREPCKLPVVKVLLSLSGHLPCINQRPWCVCPSELMVWIQHAWWVCSQSANLVVL